MEVLLQETFLVGLFAASLRLMIPILYAALGEILVERAGVLNIGIEGEMLMGALAGFLGVYYFKSVWAGLAAAMIAGMILSLVLGYLCVTLRADQMVTGITINLLALGVTSFFFRVLFKQASQPPSIPPMPKLNIPILSDIPYLGPVLFQQTGLLYAAFALVAILWILLYRTGVGLKIRAVGEYPLAAETVGIHVIRTRYVCLMAGGALAGLGGAAISLGELNLFLENMTAGRGFIALAIVIFGKWDPVRAMAGAFLFGWADALQLRLQGVGFQIPFQFLLMLPYVLTIIILVGLVGRARPPASLAVPYEKEGTLSSP
jgi:simple sugar transport system permease protein